MIDAPKPGKPVTVRDVYAEPTAIRRVLPQAGATARPTAAGPRARRRRGGDVTPSAPRSRWRLGPTAPGAAA